WVKGEPARVWDLKTGQSIALKHPGNVPCAAFSPDGRRVVTGSSDGTARVWEAATGQPVGPLLRHPAAVFHVCFSGDGRRVATASWEGRARVWEVASGKPAGPPVPC